ncbi:MAG: ArsR/SmtB family transcription factor [Planctomycetota bacterium]
MGKPELVDYKLLHEAAGCLKVMAHPVRLRIVDILSQGEFSVNEIAEYCELRPHQACEHLRLMQSHGLLDSERRGRAVYYGVASPRLPKLLQCIKATCAVER